MNTSSHAPSHPFSVAGQIALVTGGGSGIGLAIARALIEAGARVVVTGRRESVLQEAATTLGANAVALPHDVDDVTQASHLVEKVEAALGPIDILVNNAGVHLKKPAVETSPQEFQKVLNTHILGAHALVQAIAPGMMTRQGGSIIFIASMASLFGIPNVIAYSAAKSAMLGMVRTLATEVSSRGVRVNAVAPGWIETAMSKAALAGDPQRLQKILSRTPMARLGTPEDVGQAVVYLASPAARFVTGAVLPVDGGASIGF